MNEHENRCVKTDWKISGFADEISDDLRQQIDGFRRLGISFMEMRGVDGNNLIYHSDEKVREIKKRLDDAGIRLSACGSPLGKIDIIDPFPPHLESLKRAIDVAHRMGCDNIRMFSFYMPAEQRAACRSAVFDRIGQMVRCAEENGAVLLHENEKGIYGEMAAECRQLMDAFYGSHFKAIFDFANFVQAGQDTQEAFRLLRPFIAYVHVKDALAENGNVVPAGMGDGHVAEILAELAGAGFDGFLSIEPHLAHFAGFDLLEKNGVSVAKGTPPLEGFDAFELAHRSLLRILDGRTGESHG